MKYALINDTHFGVKAGNDVLLQNQIDFFTNKFLPELEKQNVSHIIHLGDVFDVRKNINVRVLQEVKTKIFDEFVKHAIEVTILVGNHDVFYKTTNKYNSIDACLSEYENINIIDIGAKELDNMILCPWLSEDNFEDIISKIKSSEAKYLLGHFEIKGFEMHKGSLCNHGLDAKTFKKFDLVMSGHFHTKSHQRNIHYLGTQYQMTWADYGDIKGFHIFDSSTGELEFIKNDAIEFYKYNYRPDIKIKDNLENKFVKLIAGEVEDRKHFEKTIQAIREQNPVDLKIVENQTLVEHSEDIELNVEDTQSLILSYINSVDIPENINRDNLKNIMIDLYTEAQQM